MDPLVALQWISLNMLIEIGGLPGSSFCHKYFHGLLLIECTGENQWLKKQIRDNQVTKVPDDSQDQMMVTEAPAWIKKWLSLKTIPTEKFSSAKMHG